MADRTKIARWRHHRLHRGPNCYRLRRGGVDIVAAQQSIKDQAWFWYTLETPEGLRPINTAGNPVKTLEAVKHQVKEWLAGNA